MPCCASYLSPSWDEEVVVSGPSAWPCHGNIPMPPGPPAACRPSAERPPVQRSALDGNSHRPGGTGDDLLGRLDRVRVEVGHLGLGDLAHLGGGDRADLL